MNNNASPQSKAGARANVLRAEIAAAEQKMKRILSTIEARKKILNRLEAAAVLNHSEFARGLPGHG